jgi:hypothetical protein
MGRIAAGPPKGGLLVLARQSDALLLLSATPHDGYDRSFASLLELLDPSLIDGGRPREDVIAHIVHRLRNTLVFN